MAVATQSARVVKGGPKGRGTNALAVQFVRYLPSPVYVTKDITEFSPPRPIEFGGFGSAEEKAHWDAVADDAWAGLDE